MSKFGFKYGKTWLYTNESCPQTNLSLSGPRWTHVTSMLVFYWGSSHPCFPLLRPLWARVERKKLAMFSDWVQTDRGQGDKETNHARRREKERSRDTINGPARLANVMRNNPKQMFITSSVCGRHTQEAVTMLETRGSLP